MSLSIESGHLENKTDGPASLAGSRRILVVDDSRVQRKILGSQISRSGLGYLVAGPAEEALEICRSDPPDLIISDWMMPGMSGVDFCRALRAIKSERYIYFILLTSKTETAEVAIGLDVGADDFLTKPITGDELRARIAAGERILRMERQLNEKNRQLSSALDELRGLYDSINRDLIEARKLQQSLVRERFRSFDGANVTLLLQPSGHVGGDLVGFFQIDARRIGVFSIDVSGHGITSALMTARLAGFLSGNTPDQNLALVRTAEGFGARPPASLAAELNRIVLTEMQTETYFTLAYADLNLITGGVEMVLAGHPHPALQRVDGSVEFVGSPGFPIGLIDDAVFETTSLSLSPGDRLFLMSDGITEAASPEGMELGNKGFSQMMVECAENRGTEFMEVIQARLSAYAPDLADDVSGALIEFGG